MSKVSQRRPRIEFHRFQQASSPELGSIEGYFPISKSPKLGLSSSFNHRQQFRTNFTQRFGENISSLLYNGSSSKQPMFGSSKSFFDTNNVVNGNKPNFPFFGNFSKGVVIGEEKLQIAQNGINNGRNNDMLGFEKIGAFNHQNFNSSPKFQGLAKLGTFENKGLVGSTSVVSENMRIGEMGNGSMTTFSVSENGLMNGFGVSSSNNENQQTFELASQHQKIGNNRGNDVAIFGLLDNLSDSGSTCFPQQFGGQGDASFTWLNQNNIQSQTQVDMQRLFLFFVFRFSLKTSLIFTAQLLN